jgi:DNA polymerase I
MASPKLVIIDGHSLLYRAFFAVPPLSTRDGTPTNAVYGFLRMLLKLWREERPDYLVIAFDAPTPTFRHQQFADYKAQRAKAPDAFRPQVGLLRQILKTVGIAFWELDGYEADDLMATAVTQARPMGVQVVLVTGDMDALQLVGDGVVALMPKRGISEMERYDAERVRQEFGVPPERIPDLKGLAGDASDNLPGVPGIGEKTARELLGEFGSLEGVLENAAKIPKPQVRENLLRFADQARQCKTLATLKSDAPINLNLDELSVHRWRWRSPEVAELLMQLEMRTLLEELGLTELLAEEASVKGMVIKDEAAWTEALQAIRQQGRVAFALDGTERQPKGVALAWKGAVAYLPLAPSTEFAETASLFAGEKERAEANARGQTLPDGQQWLLTLLTDVTLIKSAHHWKRLLKALGPIAIERCGMTPRGFEDAELLAYLLNPSQGDYAWKPLAMERRLPTKFHIAWDGDETAPTDACEEALTVAELAPLLVNEVREAGMWELWERIEMPLLFVLADMERHGVLVDVGYLRQLGEEMQRMARQLEEQIYRMAGVRFNLRSPQQLAEVLFRRLRLPMPQADGGWATVNGSAHLGSPRQRTRNRPPHPAVSGTGEIAGHFRGRAADGCRRARARSHNLRPDRDGDGAIGIVRTQPAKHSRSGRMGQKSSARLHRPQRLSLAECRLFAD